jgi:hypothetical protein
MCAVCANEEVPVFEKRPRQKRSSITRISTNSDGKPFAIYLRDGTKILVGREPGKTVGPAWLEIVQQDVVKAQEA